MVFFICNHCGESMKKQVVEKHGWKCKRELNVSCMDCQKDFTGNAYDAHTSCITEAEKYSGKDYVPKANANKGAKKQEAWIDTVRAITDSKKNLPRGISEVFSVIHKNDNIPRKQKGFMNFFQNSAKHIKRHDVEAAWALLEEEVKNTSTLNQQKQSNGSVNNGNSGNTNESTTGTEHNFKKRKLEENKEASPQNEAPSKKQKKQKNGVSEEHEQLVNEDHAAENDSEETQLKNGKFKWNDVIRDTLIAKNNEMSFNKLKKKVLKKYRKFIGGSDETCEKIERKFSKKITKLGLQMDNETVRLIE
ncbi:uncharacterized protein C16C10.8 [Toxorhynchites rutilus septentrionalis]|uniref:uncharacterized protein C16C10.8 n=1 Tax=Toxorhynchites rutilus septentrionalis TaxID=329112 RepID=UPI002479A338|nr:uncharacterized protein C16C10.8 [Toxorhynchites rutilus septentrionalis]